MVGFRTDTFIIRMASAFRYKSAKALVIAIGFKVLETTCPELGTGSILAKKDKSSSLPPVCAYRQRSCHAQRQRCQPGELLRCKASHVNVDKVLIDALKKSIVAKVGHVDTHPAIPMSTCNSTKRL